MPSGTVTLTDGDGRVLQRLSHEAIDRILGSRTGETRSLRVAHTPRPPAPRTPQPPRPHSNDSVVLPSLPPAGEKRAIRSPEELRQSSPLIAEKPIDEQLKLTQGAVQKRCGRIGRGDANVTEYPELAAHLSVIRRLAETGPTRVIREGAQQVLTHFAS